MIYNSPYKVKNASETIDALRQDKEIIIFGTGNFGQIVLAALKKIGLKTIFFSEFFKSGIDNFCDVLNLEAFCAPSIDSF